MRSRTGGGVGPQHVQARTVGDDIDINVFVLGLIIFDHVAGVVQRQVHDLGIVLVDLDGDAMQFAFGGEPAEANDNDIKARMAQRRSKLRMSDLPRVEPMYSRFQSATGFARPRPEPGSRPQ